ncbi:MAG: hypothetical protein IT320_25560 [Anaerolineae bacterium]|nr:hypothetical protein [Anaerolineae bacterium]
MTEEPKHRMRGQSPTGHVPRVDPATGKIIDPPQPPDLPEFSDVGGTTGFMPSVRAESIDSSKEADDSASSGQSEQFTGKRSN